MKTRIKTLIIICLIGLSFVACSKEDELVKYHGDNMLYFMWAKEGKDNTFISNYNLDSIAVSFAYDAKKKTDTIIRIPFKIQGKTSNEDREINLSIANGSTAKAGIDFDIPNTIVIPADSVMNYIPITFKRTQEMESKVLSLKLKLLENKNFKTGVLNRETKVTGLYEQPERLVSYDQFEITVSDILTKPEYWYRVESYFGKFSSKKIRLIAEVNNIPLPKYNVYDSPEYLDASNYANKLKNYLAKQKKAGTPVLEDDGTEMTLDN